MKRILIVDDEQGILDGLRNLLRKQRRRWDMVFALGAEAALSTMNGTSFDVVVSDMRMPGMDGAELLRRVKADHPKVVRLILSGHAEREAIFRALPIAHQFLSKPCDAELLPNVIERACELQALVTDERLVALIGRDRLPSPPGCYWEITSAMADPETATPRIAAILERDPQVSAKLLQLANSTCFGSPEPISHVRQAVSFLGLECVRSLALAAHFLRPLDAGPRIPGFPFEPLQCYSLLTAKVARRLMGSSPLAQEAFTAALLHDLGKLTIATTFPDAFAKLIAATHEGRALSTDEEKEALGITHAEAGACLLGLWGLPTPIVEAVAYHHAPARVPQRGFELVACVHVADALVSECLPPIPGITGTEPALDLAHLETLGVAGKLPAWREIAAEEVRRWSRAI